MKKNLKSVAGYAAVAVKAILVMVSVLFLSVNFSSCDTGIDDEINKGTGCTDCPDPNPDPDPEKKVDYIDHYGCTMVYMEEGWSRKNAEFTRSAEYSVDASDGGVFNDATMQYLADIVYTDGTTQNANAEYEVRSSFVGFGFRNTLYVAAGEAASFNEDPTIETTNASNGVVTFVKWERKTLAFLANTFNSVKSLTIGGKTMNDLCDANVEYKYTGSELIADGDSANYHMYNLRVYGDATVSYSGDTSTKNFYIVQRIAEAKEGGVTPPEETDPEVVDYQIVNENINSNGIYTGDLEEILSDGSTNKVGTINFTYQYSFQNESPKTVQVNELTYTKLSPSYGENIRTGEVRVLNQFDCNITLTGMMNTAVMMINRGSLTFTGYWEYPVLLAPNGKEIELLHNVAEVRANNITDGGVQGNQMVVTMTADGSFGSNSKQLSSTITLVKSNGGSGDGENIQTGAYAKDQRIEGGWIKWTLVRTFSNAENTETAMSIEHKYNLSVEERKYTQYRTYNAATPSMNLVSSSSFNEGNYSGTFSQYTSTFVYADFRNTISSEGRTSISYKDGNFDVDVWSASLLVEKQGVTFGRQNISNSEDVEKYIDLINYTLFAGNTGVKSGEQEVEYSKSIEKTDVITKGVTKGEVTEDGKLHYTYWIKHSEKPELNSETEYTLDLQGVITSKQIAGWTTTAEKAGLSLINPTLNYTTAMDYNYGSNRGNVEAYASMVENFTVTHDGVDYQLSVNGTVNGSVTRTSSSSTQNVYRVTSELKADGVVIARDAADAIETIKAEVVDEITYDVQKVKVENGKLYYNEITRHSVNTDQNTSVEKSIPLEYSINTTAVNDWTAKEGATGISLNSHSQNYSGAKDYIFGSNRGNNVVNASLKTTYTVTFMNEEYTLTVTGAVQASVAMTGSTSTTNVYTVTGKLLADGVEVAADSDNCVETVEPTETDEVSYSVEKKGVSGDRLYYYEITRHSLNTDEDSKVEKSIPLVYSITATACNDWTAKEGAAGISLNSTSQNYSGAKAYTFGSNRGNHTVNASLQTSYNVSFQGKSYSLTISGKVNASISRTAYTSTTNTYTFTGMLLADNVQIASDNDNCVETVEPNETDKVTYSVEKIGVENGKLYYNEIETHTVNSDQNKTAKKSVDLIYSLNVRATADWEAEEGATGINLTTSSQNYNGARDYLFGSNRGNNTVTASLQTSYVVVYGGTNHTLTVNGTVNGNITRTSSTSNTNTYTFTGTLLADGVALVSKTDNCVETVKEKIDLDYYGIANVYSAVTFDTNAKPYVTFAAVYKNGMCIVKNANNVEVARGKAPNGTVTEQAGVPVRIQDMGDYYLYTDVNGNMIGEVPMTEIVIHGYPNGILSADTNVSESNVTVSNKYGSATFGNY